MLYLKMDGTLSNLNPCSSNSNCFPIECTDSTNQTASAARDILRNGILVETAQGLICMSLKDALERGVGGLALSEKDFHNLATKLLVKTNEVPKLSINERIRVIKPISINKTIKSEPKQIMNNITTDKTMFIKNTTPNMNVKNELTSKIVPKMNPSTENSLLPGSKSSYLELVTPGNSETAKRYIVRKSPMLGSKLVPRTQISSCERKPVMLVTNSTRKGGIIDIKKENDGKQSNVLGDDSELLVNTLAIRMRKYDADELETSDNSEAAQASGEMKTVKKRGGWPKGRKRKPELKSEIRPPKAPATGYVIYLNEKRKDYKDLPFTEVTKLLGNEWSKLSLQDKKKYLDQADLEKRRYREELKVYRQSDAYRNYLFKKRMKKLQGNGTEESDMDATDDIDDEDNEELYCRLCDQWFHSLHNKKEHLYGRQHLQSIAGRVDRDKLTVQDLAHPSMSSTSVDESSLDGSSFVSGSGSESRKQDWIGDPLNFDSAIVRFTALSKEREEEMKLLRETLKESQAKHEALQAESSRLNIKTSTLARLLEDEKCFNSELEQKLYELFFFCNEIGQTSEGQ